MGVVLRKKLITFATINYQESNKQIEKINYKYEKTIIINHDAGLCRHDRTGKGRGVGAAHH